MLIAASIALAVLSVACGLGDIPTRPPRSADPSTPGPSTATTLSPSPSLAAAISPSAPPSPTAQPAPSSIVYTVKAGDSLLLIAKRFKTSARSIAFWNRATYKRLDPDSPSYNPNNIEIGWRLTITPGVKIEDAGASPSG